MNQSIRERLLSLAEPKYGAFSASLIPDCDNLIGVRLPTLRKLAKELVKNQAHWRELLVEPDVYFEEIMLRGMIIGLGCDKDKDVDKGIETFCQFVPKVKNWSVCDSFCVSFALCEQNREAFLPIITELLESGEEFKVRIGFVMLLNHYVKVSVNGKKISRKKVVDIKDIEGIDDNTSKYLAYIFKRLAKNHTEGYYAQMAAAWLLAECFVTYPNRTWDFMNGIAFEKMDKATYNKALSKICESKNPSDEVKVKIKALKKH